MKTTVFSLLLLLPFTFAFNDASESYHDNSTPTVTVTSCASPSNLTCTGQTSTTASLSWNSCSPCLISGFQLYYYRTEDNYTSSAVQTGNTYYTFQNLSPGHYRFFVASICTEGGTSSDIWYDVIQN